MKKLKNKLSNNSKNFKKINKIKTKINIWLIKINKKNKTSRNNSIFIRK